MQHGAGRLALLMRLFFVAVSLLAAGIVITYFAYDYYQGADSDRPKVKEDWTPRKARRNPYLFLVWADHALSQELNARREYLAIVRQQQRENQRTLADKERSRGEIEQRLAEARETLADARAADDWPAIFNNTPHSETELKIQISSFQNQLTLLEQNIKSLRQKQSDIIAKTTELRQQVAKGEMLDQTVSLQRDSLDIVDDAEALEAIAAEILAWLADKPSYNMTLNQ